MASEKEKKGRSDRQNGDKAQSRAHDQKKDDARDLKRQDDGSSKENKSSRSKKREFKLEPGQSETTTNHNTIRQWVEERGGKPATVAATESKNDSGLLRIDYPGRGGENRLEEISWEDFFEKFEEKQLAFLYQEQTKTGRVSRFSKFVARDAKKK